MNRKLQFLRTLPIVLFATLSMSSHAAYPEKPIKLIVPFSAGGPTDLLGRAVAQQMSEKLGQPVVVENRVGGGGSIGIGTVVRATPDGYTLGYGSASTLAINSSIYKLDYDPIKDLVPIGLVGIGPYTIVAHPSMPADLKAFAAYGRRNPGKLNMGSSGIGSSPHIAGVLFNNAVGLDVVHIPYKGASQGLPAVASGEIQYMLDSPGTSKTFAAGGRLNILAVTSLNRSALLPDVPTVSETLLPGFSATSWSGLVAPAGTPPEIITKLSQILREIIVLPDLQNSLRINGYSSQMTSPAEFGRFIAEENLKWSGAVKKAGIKQE